MCIFFFRSPGPEHMMQRWCSRSVHEMCLVAGTKTQNTNFQCVDLVVASVSVLLQLCIRNTSSLFTASLCSSSVCYVVEI